MNTESAAGLLYLIAAHPDLLPAAPAVVDDAALHHRAARGGHVCLGCGKTATAAITVNSTSAGPRWLDLCSDCWHAVREANDLSET
ncbi:hypothetical protein [Streptomyces sp. NPDC058308]|uniref:hypothetical protein n=1 Tax=Streptomyces sp. NPDC058308 TaxID=3346440 RepID=UPI0036E75137